MRVSLFIRMFHFFAVGVFLVAPRAVAAESELIPEIAGFESWKAATSDPIPVPEYLYTLCRAPDPYEVAIMSSPHRTKHVRVRVNPIGEKAFFSKTLEAFPVGSVIVKEKFPGSEFKDAESLGAMVKVEGGWEFIYKEKNKSVSRGRQQLENCYRCHSSLKGGDQVFRTYLRKR